MRSSQKIILVNTQITFRAKLHKSPTETSARHQRSIDKRRDILSQKDMASNSLDRAGEHSLQANTPIAITPRSQQERPAKEN